MRRAARSLNGMHEVIREKAEVGRRKNDLISRNLPTPLSAVAHGALGRLPRLRANDTPVWMPPRRIFTWDDAPLRNNEGTFFEIAGAHRRLPMPAVRAPCFWQTATKISGLRKMPFSRAIDAGLETKPKPGNRCEDYLPAAFNNHPAPKRGFRERQPLRCICIGCPILPIGEQ